MHLVLVDNEVTGITDEMFNSENVVVRYDSGESSKYLTLEALKGKISKAISDKNIVGDVLFDNICFIFYVVFKQIFEIFFVDKNIFMYCFIITF